MPDTPLSQPQSARVLSRRLGLRLVRPADLTLRRQRQGEGFIYFTASGRRIRDKRVLARLRRLAVPPAYEDVLYASDPHAHLQAIGRDAAGRQQYRYHPDWEQVRETRKAQRLAQFVKALPRIRRHIGRVLAGDEPTREFALAAVIELVANTSIRAGSDAYVKERGTRGAATLLKSNVRLRDGSLLLHFTAKGGKDTQREADSPRLLQAVETLRRLPGRRLFQYRDETGIHPVHAQDVNRYLHEIADVPITLKDFRTLCASAAVLDELSRLVPAKTESGRKRQVRRAIMNAAEELANTPAVCRKSYVHAAVVEAFENGVLEDYGEALKAARSPVRREVALAEIVAHAR